MSLLGKLRGGGALNWEGVSSLRFLVTSRNPTRTAERQEYGSTCPCGVGMLSVDSPCSGVAATIPG